MVFFFLFLGGSTATLYASMGDKCRVMTEGRDHDAHVERHLVRQAAGHQGATLVASPWGQALSISPTYTLKLCTYDTRVRGPKCAWYPGGLRGKTGLNVAFWLKMKTNVTRSKLDRGQKHEILSAGFSDASALSIFVYENGSWEA